MAETKKISKMNYFIEFSLINVFILDILGVSISSYNLRSFLIKLISIILLSALTILHYKIVRPDLSVYFSSTNFTKLLYSLLFFIIIFSVSLFYSANPLFGALKLINFLLGTIPAVLIFYYLIITHSPIRNKIFFISVFIEIVILISAITLIQPFSYDGSTTITLTDWSHVIYGHFIAPIYLLFLLALLNNKKSKYIYYLAAGTFLSFYGTYISGLKAAFYGIIIFTAIILLVYLFKKLLSLKVFTAAASVIILSFSLILFLQPVEKRLSERLNIFDSNFDDASTVTRLEALKISSKIFLEHPFIGVGFGGFKNYNGNELTNYINYPHNIIIEFAVELGIIGLAVFIYLLYLIFSSTKKISFNAAIFFCFALWFAMISKDIPSNVLLWIGTAFYGLKKE